MKKRLFLISSFFAFSPLATSAAPNLVPPPPEKILNYWCTWYAQNYWIGHGTDLKDTKLLTNEGAREEINYKNLFDPEKGWASTYLPQNREDFIFLIDHGWQTKDPKLRIAGGGDFYNMITDPSDFPEYADLPPKERLVQFNKDIKKQGWNSLGLWVRGNIDKKTARTFVQWSKDAGIRYWKIDGGDTKEFHAWHAKRDLYPELILEYITGSGGNINPGYTGHQSSYPSVYDIGGSLQKAMLSVLQHTDVFRTYDAAPLLMSSTTLRRTHDILKQTQQQSQYTAILNVQDDCNVAVGLGVLVASKRHPNYGERTLRGKDIHHQLSGLRRMQKRMNEVARLGRWNRIAPAFPAGEGSYLSSEHELIDRCQFTEYDTWNRGTYGKMISQSAPAIMARNMPLPQVEKTGDLAPFVCATTYPNGALGIATEGRVTPEQQWLEPRAKITVKVKDAAQPIGIVGSYDELILEFADELPPLDHLWAQDLLSNEAKDIKEEVTISTNTLRLSGKLIDQIGTAAGTPGDLSVPGMVLQLSGENLPVAGDDYTPKTRPVTTAQKVTKYDAVEVETYADGYAGTASGLIPEAGQANFLQVRFRSPWFP